MSTASADHSGGDHSPTTRAELDGLTITVVHRRPTAFEVYLRGEADLANHDFLAEQLANVVAARPTRLVIDLADLTFIDAGGGHILRAAYDHAKARRCDVRLRAATGNAKLVLDTFDLDT